MNGMERRRTDWFAQFNGTPGKYTPFAFLELDGATEMRCTLNGDVVAIKKYKKCNTEIIGLLIGIRHSNIVYAMGIESYSDYIEVLQEPMLTNLSQVLVAPMKFNEGQIATVCNEVC